MNRWLDVSTDPVMPMQWMIQAYRSKTKCVDRMIFIGQASSRRAVAEYADHYHWERTIRGAATNYRNAAIAAHDGPIYPAPAACVECSTSTTRNGVMSSLAFLDRTS
jgi:hypothetical protein